MSCHDTHKLSLSRVLKNSSASFPGDTSCAPQLRAAVATELFTHAKQYAEHPLFIQASDVMGGVSTILQSLLTLSLDGDATMIIKQEALLSNSNRRWSSLLNVMALATVLNKPIVSHFPDVEHYASDLYRSTLEPLQHENPNLPSFNIASDQHTSIQILWTRDGSFDHSMNVFVPNHVVAVIKPCKIPSQIVTSSTETSAMDETSDQSPPVFQIFTNLKKKKLNSGKEKLTKILKHERDSKYDRNDRLRKFQPVWKEVYRWLDYNENERHMFCTTCRKYPHLSESTGSFFKGCVNFRKEAVEAHDKTRKHVKAQDHLKAVERREAASFTLSGKPANPGDRAMNLLTAADIEQRRKLFLIAHALAKKDRPFTDFKWQCDLLEGVGELRPGSGMYRNDKQAATFVHYIAEVEKSALEKELHASPFVAIICDGSTDSSVQEQELMMVRYTSKLDVRTKFFAIGSVARPNARNITDCITDACSTYPNVKEKIIALGSDGAAVMQGKKNGVIKLLQDEVDGSIIGVHCCAHRLELAYKDVIKDQPLHGKLDRFLLDLYLFYHNSAVQRSNLMNAFRAFNIPSAIPTRVGGTRWLPHTKRALRNLFAGYRAIVEHLDQIQHDPTASKDAKGKAKGFSLILHDREIMMFAHFLADVVDVLASLSLVFQQRRATLCAVHSTLAATKQSLRRLQAQAGPHFSKIQGVNSHAFHGVSLQQENHRLHHDNLEEVTNRILQNTIAAIEKRFKDVDEGIVKASRVIDFSIWPAENRDGFGEVEIAAVTAHYQGILQRQGVSMDDIIHEWIILRNHIYSRDEALPTLQWTAVYNATQDQCANVLKVVSIILTIPVHSADCERGFSYMKHIKSDWRSCLSILHLNDIMRVKMLTPEVGQFDPMAALKKWQAGGKRNVRPGTESNNSLPMPDSESDTEE